MRSFFTLFYDFLILNFASVERLSGGPKAANYYLKYLEYGEAPGIWYDPEGVLEEFGIKHGDKISTPQDIEAFKRLCAGRNPLTNKPLLASGKVDEAHTAGVDIQLAPPKDFSVLWALADPEMHALLDNAYNEAVAETLEMIRSRYVYTRLAKDGKEHVASSAMIGATFHHSESRSGDPQPHAHNFGLNLIKSPDGKWRALEAKYIMEHQKLAGAWLNSSLAAKLTKNLGFTVKPDPDAGFRIPSVPSELQEMWSSRSKQILKYAKEKGLLDKNGKFTSADARNKAIFDTRPDKTMRDGNRFERWQAEAKQLNIDISKVFERTPEEDVQHTVDMSDRSLKSISTMDYEPTVLDEAPTTEETLNFVFEHESVLADKDAIRRVMEYNYGHKTPAECEALFKQLVAEKTLIPLRSNDSDKIHYTTKEIYQIERELVELTRRLDQIRPHEVQEELVEDFLSRTTATDEQKEAVRYATRGNSITAVEGSAGAGKTFTTKTICDIYIKAGYDIQGLALGWKQANVLKRDAQLEKSCAIEGYVRDLENDKVMITNKTVLVLDEAGLVGSKHMYKLLNAVEKGGGKIILVGDEKQLNPVLAGPAMKLVIQETGSIRIDKIVRQEQEWQRQMVADLRDGHSHKAIVTMEQNGYLIESENSDETLQRVSRDFFDDMTKNKEDSRILMVVSNKELVQVSQMVRDLKKDAGLISGTDYTITCDIADTKVKLDFAVGDTVRFTQKDKKIGINNKDEGTVIAITSNRHAGIDITVQLLNDKIVKINTAIYINKKNKAVPMRYSDVATVYSAQGETTKRAFLVFHPAMDRKLAYVGCSRFKESMRMYYNKDTVDRMLRLRDDQSSSRNQRIGAISKRIQPAREKMSTFDYEVIDMDKDIKVEKRVEDLFSKVRVAKFIAGLKKWYSRITEQIQNKEIKYGQVVTR